MHAATLSQHGGDRKTRRFEVGRSRIDCSHGSIAQRVRLAEFASTNVVTDSYLIAVTTVGGVKR